MLSAAVLRLPDVLRVLVRSVDAVSRIKKWFIVFHYCLNEAGEKTRLTTCARAPCSSRPHDLAVNLPASTTYLVLFSS